MANVTLYPMIDGYRTTLSQQYTGGTGSMYVNSVPGFTFPGGTTTMVTINAGKTNQQVVIIDGYNGTTKTLNVSSITVSKGEGVSYTAQTHNIGSEVIISDNFFFWEKLVDAINSKVNADGSSDIVGGNITFSGDATKYGVSVKALTTTERDALSSPPNGVIIYNSTSGVFQKREAGAWSDFGSGSVSNATSTAGGKIELPTQSEVETGTDTGSSGPLAVQPSQINPNTITSATPATGDKLSFADISDSNKLKSNTLQTLIDTARPLATNAEASTGSGTTQSITPEQLKKYFGAEPSAGTTYTAGSATGSLYESGTSYVQKRIGTILRTGTYTVSFDVGSGPGVNGYGRIYKNGVAFGTERIVTNTTTNFSENLAFTESDTISLWCKSGGGGSASISNLYVKYDQSNGINFTIS